MQEAQVNICTTIQGVRPSRQEPHLPLPTYIGKNRPEDILAIKIQISNPQYIKYTCKLIKLQHCC